MDTDQAGEESELQVRKCEGRNNDASKKKKERKEGRKCLFFDHYGDAGREIWWKQVGRQEKKRVSAEGGKEAV